MFGPESNSFLNINFQITSKTFPIYSFVLQGWSNFVSLMIDIIGDWIWIKFKSFFNIHKIFEIKMFNKTDPSDNKLVYLLFWYSQTIPLNVSFNCISIIVVSNIVCFALKSLPIINLIIFIQLNVLSHVFHLLIHNLKILMCLFCSVFSCVFIQFWVDPRTQISTLTMIAKCYNRHTFKIEY